ncbi:MAG: DUF481 domain-containing protein [Phaeodactylibacter xiamenensis]|uniref:DUF481 domain-containing protein n=1 Tax=Phaeodactylibacter xiamenensis TaxID=1524460 RepID=A0A098S979_9BACT|nr:DUF481 domain-containing protein [Phaeodactylibacter xiamenensis]KGE88666.1 hypothetical protein IX84_08345 [Phaeodactylibacter xiamenensis]MCR9054307.1 DUF481 domain-containing protein [bacterium]
MRNCLFILLFMPAFLSAQVVNTEKLRSTNEDGWLAEAGLDFGLTRNKAGQTLSLGSRLRLEYDTDKSRWMVLGAYNLTQFRNVEDPGSVPRNFANNAFGHLRYNYLANDWLTWEAFTQFQYDQIQQIDARVLTGTGPRVKLLRTDSSQLFFGLLYMYEHEASTDVFEVPEERSVNVYLYDHRLSTYLSGGFQVTETFNINHVTYFQPNLADLGDFRISSETSLTFKISEKLAFRTYFQLMYDERPPIPVPNTMYSLNNGLEIAL